MRRNNGAEEYYSIKTVKPNLDQVEIAKRDMLRISTAKPNCRAYLGLPYNPDGEGNLYTWTIPKKLFDMNNSPAVLIGASFWNAVGASDTTFIELLELFREIGVESKERITNDFLEFSSACIMSTKFRKLNPFCKFSRLYFDTLNIENLVMR
ncbi:MAG: TdeIII family type II restriction endonuclease [Eubacteriales bacterium]